MSSFDQRQDAFESKFKHEEEQKFKITARRNKLLGLWAAAKLGLESGEADAYAASVVMADLEKPGDEDVLQKVLGDLQAAKLAIVEGDVRFEMDYLYGVASKQLEG